MRLPAFLEGLPRTAWLFAIPAVAFLVTIGIVVATSGGGDDGDKVAAVPTVRLTNNNLDAAPTVAPTRAAQATPTPEPNRANCNTIRGTDYQSGTEREWFLANCSGSGSTASSSGGGGGSSSAGSGGGGGYAVESGLGARLVIPAAGVNAPVSQTSVGASGAMPDPVGYDNAVLYNFPSHPGMGGPNKVVAGHVDCGRCRNGGPGTAVFYSVRSLKVGDTAQWIGSDGSVKNYVVKSSYSISANTDFSSIVSSGAADLTIITCTGSFVGGEYTNRHVVAFAEA